MADFAAAKTNAFMLGEATVMLGPQADLYKLTPTNNGIGLVKNFQLVSDVGYVELTQGVQNNIVHSTMNKSMIRATFEVYEYTSKNLAYALGMDGSGLTTNTVATTLSGAVTGSVTTPATSIDLTSATGLAQGDWILIQGAAQDDIYVTQIASLTGTTATVSPGIPAAVADDSVVRKVTRTALASSVEQPFLSMAAVGKLADGTQVKVVIPKIRVTKGFTMQFDTKNYGNMPFEATVYRPVSTDPVYTGFETRAADIFSV